MNDEHDCDGEPGHVHEPDGSVIQILPAELFGVAQAENDMLNIGGCLVPLPWYADGRIGVYVRRSSGDLSIIEVHLARHDGLADEENEERHHQAMMHVGGPKAYWYEYLVGHEHDDDCGHDPMTPEEYNELWESEIRWDYEDGDD